MRHTITILIFCTLLWSCAGTRPAPTPTAMAFSSGSDIHAFVTVADAARALGKKYGNHRVLVVYDIDNTLLASTILLGSDQWFDWQSKDAPEQEKISDSVACLLKAQGILYHLGSMQSTETAVAEVVGALQSEDFPSLVVTSRGSAFRLATHRELRRNGLDFSRTAPRVLPTRESPAEYLPYNQNHISGFTEEEIAQFQLIQSASRPRPVRYEDGIYFTAGQHKGAMLRLLLARSGALDAYDAIVFVDDKSRHIAAMIDAMTAIDKEVVAYRYAGQDANVANFRANTDNVRLAARSAWCGVASTLVELGATFGDEIYPGVDAAGCVSLTRNICAN